MEAKQIIDVDQRSNVCDDREEPIEDSCGHVLVKGFCASAETCRPQSADSEPEQHRQSPKVGHADHSEQPAEAKHGQVADETVEDGVLWYMPLFCLRDRGDDSQRTSKLREEGRGRNDREDNQLLKLGPVEGIIGIIARLRDSML